MEIAFQFSFEPSPKMQIHNQLSAICCLFVCLVVCSVCLHTHDSNNFAFSRTVCRLLYFRCQGRSSPRWYLLLPTATPTSAPRPPFSFTINIQLSRHFPIFQMNCVVLFAYLWSFLSDNKPHENNGTGGLCCKLIYVLTKYSKRNNKVILIQKVI